MIRLSFLALALLLSSKRCFGNLTSTVNTTSGPVQGQILHTIWHSYPYSAFMGIPYATPPLKNLRFQPPVPPASWSETLNATQERSVCPQKDFLTNTYMGDEDCLYINVFTPVLDFTNDTTNNTKAVLVWIYGGSFITGYSNTSLYGPDLLLEKNVVMVSFNYRLGALGFLSLSRDRALGNAGLKDQVLALEWVQKNIAAFGGDPNRVTIFGESAGAVSVHYLMMSPRSKGLFQQSYAISGTALTRWGYHTPPEAWSNAWRLGTMLGKVTLNADDLIDFFLQVPAMDIVKATEEMYGPIPATDVLPFRPTMENADITTPNRTFLTECPFQLYTSGQFEKMPTMLGFTQNEILVFAGPIFGITNETLDYITSSLVRNGIMNAVVTGTNETSLILSDFLFVAPIDLTRKIMQQYNGNYPIYYYYQSYDSPYAIHKQMGIMVNGTAHFDDIQYFFQSTMFYAPTDPNDSFNQFRDRMTTMLTNFAKYGNPTPNNSNPINVNWVPSGQEGLQLYINENCTMGPARVDQIASYYEQISYATEPFLEICKNINPLLPASSIF
ncbi:juvenile hormone esterase-like [Ptiloglossa arizonensis]|uniref:juvenile hormone esterase-like n=1 Tax=Ptiloglossa arizonensis TaxID=3350558 RepID=UPI003F9F1E9F